MSWEHTWYISEKKEKKIIENQLLQPCGILGTGGERGNKKSARL